MPFSIKKLVEKVEEVATYAQKRAERRLRSEEDRNRTMERINKSFPSIEFTYMFNDPLNYTATGSKGDNSIRLEGSPGGYEARLTYTVKGSLADMREAWDKLNEED